MAAEFPGLSLKGLLVFECTILCFIRRNKPWCLALVAGGSWVHGYLDDTKEEMVFNYHAGLITQRAEWRIPSPRRPWKEVSMYNLKAAAQSLASISPNLGADWDPPF